jgi:hypothetical protein
MSQPNFEKIAKVLLWNVAGLQAEIASLKAQIDGLMKALGKPPSEEYVKFCEKQDAETQMQVFRDACAQAGLNDEPPDMLKGISQN